MPPRASGDSRGASSSEHPPRVRAGLAFLRSPLTPMLHADLAETPLASHWPDMSQALDTPADRLRERLSFLPATWRERVVAVVLDFLAEESAASGPDPLQILTEGLRAVYRDTSHEKTIRIIAAAALKRLGKDGRSYQAMGDEFGVTRACVQAHSRRIERNTGLKCRADKSDSARAQSVRNASGPHPRTSTPACGILRDSRPVIARIFSAFRLRGI